MDRELSGSDGLKVNLAARIAYIDGGTPVTGDAEIISITQNGAIVSVSHSLKCGDKIGLMIEGLKPEITDIFSRAEVNGSRISTIKTQAIVDQVLQGEVDSTCFSLLVRFTGNMRFAEANELA